MKTKFKVGDRVNYVRFGNGTIIDIDTGNLTTQYLVEFDEENETYLHSGSGKGKDNHCYCISSNDSKLVKIKENQEYVTKAEFEEFKKSINKLIEIINKPVEATGCVKQEEKPKDRADKDQRYWYIDSFGDVSSCYESYYETDNYRYKTGNYYLTEEECKRAKEIRDILLKYSYRFSTEELENTNVEKYEIFADIDAKKIKMHQMYYCLTTNFKFNNQEDCQKAIDEIGYEDYLRYCVRGDIK